MKNNGQHILWFRSIKSASALVLQPDYNSRPEGKGC